MYVSNFKFGKAESNAENRQQAKYTMEESQNLGDWESVPHKKNFKILSLKDVQIVKPIEDDTDYMDTFKRKAQIVDNND